MKMGQSIYHSPTKTSITKIKVIPMDKLFTLIWTGTCISYNSYKWLPTIPAWKSIIEQISQYHFRLISSSRELSKFSNSKVLFHYWLVCLIDSLTLPSTQFLVHLRLGDTGNSYIKKESTRRSSNKCRKNLNRIYLLFNLFSGVPIFPIHFIFSFKNMQKGE